MTYPTTDVAQARLKTLLTQNRGRARELVQRIQEAVIDDYMREPKDIVFATNSPAYKELDLGLPDVLTISFKGSKLEHYKIHPHALSQIGTRLQIEAGYVRRLNVETIGNWRRLLLRDNLNTLLYNTEFSK